MLKENKMKRRNERRAKAHIQEWTRIQNDLAFSSAEIQDEYFDILEAGMANAIPSMRKNLNDINIWDSEF